MSIDIITVAVSIGGAVAAYLVASNTYFIKQTLDEVRSLRKDHHQLDKIVSLNQSDVDDMRDDLGDAKDDIEDIEDILYKKVM